MKRRYVYAPSMVLLAAVVAAIAWGERPSDRDPSPSGAQAGALLTLFDQPRPVPPLHFQNAAGQTLALADFRGRVLLVNIWATWCRPCRKEMPSLDRLQAQLSGPDFQVVAISQDRAGLDVVNAFYEDVGIQHLKRYIDVDAQSLDALSVIGIPTRGIPTSMLVDRQGRLLGYAIGARDWASQAMIDLIKRVADLQSAGNP